MSKLSFPFKNKTVGATEDSLHFQEIDLSREVMIPVGPAHPGAFGFRRKFHIHEGVDLYCRQGEAVHALEDGVVVNVLPFTGAHANSPWWENTFAVMVEGKSGVMNYGELIPAAGVNINTEVRAGQLIGNVIRVLKIDKGRPQDMLHFELYEPGRRDPVTWKVGDRRPEGLCDPTSALIGAAAKDITECPGVEDLLLSLEMTWLSALIPAASLHTLKKCFLKLSLPYQSESRHYHTLEHLRFMLDIMETLADQIKHPVSLLLATFVHDLVYVAGRKDNEIRGARHGCSILKRFGFPDSILDRVADLTLLSSKHLEEFAHGEDTDAAIFLDADLAILGSPPETYDRYANNIFREFANVESSNLQKERRQAFLKSMLAKKTIYHHPVLLARFEDQARVNLRREFNSLTGQK